MRRRFPVALALAPLLALGLAPRPVLVAVVAAVLMAAATLGLLLLIARAVLPPADPPRR